MELGTEPYGICHCLSHRAVCTDLHIIIEPNSISLSLCLCKHTISV